MAHAKFHKVCRISATGTNKVVQSANYWIAIALNKVTDAGVRSLLLAEQHDLSRDLGMLDQFVRALRVAQR